MTTAVTLSVPHDTRFWWRWASVLLIASFLVVLATLPPLVSPVWRALLMQAFSGACHQIAERSPAIGSIPLAVCHRCYGIYGGLAIAPLLYLGIATRSAFLSRYAVIILFGSLMPAATDWLLGVIGVWHNSPASRLLTGALFGIVAGVYLVRPITQTARNSNRNPLAIEE